MQSGPAHVRLATRYFATEESTGLTVDVEPGAEGIVLSEEADTLTVLFANYGTPLRVSRSQLVTVDPTGKLPPHAFWPTNEGAESPGRVLVEVAPLYQLQRNFPDGDGTIMGTGHYRAGDAYFVEDAHAAQQALVELNALVQSLRATPGATTEAVTSLISGASGRLPPGCSSLARDLNLLVAEVMSPKTRLTVDQVALHVESMACRLECGSPSDPHPPTTFISYVT